MSLVALERLLAILGALIVGVSALTSLRAEWKKSGLDDQISKIMLALLTLGCIIVILAASGIVGRA
jgi:hypothetical protein